MATALKKEPETVTLSDLVRAALDDADGAWVGAQSLVLERLRVEPETAWQAVESHLANVVWEEIRRQARHSRQGFIRLADAEDAIDEAHAAATDRLRDVARLGFYDYPMSGGLKLGDATRADLDMEAQIHAAHERGNRRKKTWYRLIAGKLPKSKPELKVREKIDEDTLRDLMEKSEQE